jgi:predicted phosphoribosyltransferase
MRFKNRTEAGFLLAECLDEYSHHTNLLVLALPRGGAPVAAEVARRLHAPLDIFMVRKMGLPGHEELAMGAVASGGAMVLNQDVIDRFGVPKYAIESVAAVERTKLTQQERILRNHRPPVGVAGKTIILVDDGIATGASISAAYQALKDEKAKEIIIATPVLPAELFDGLQLIHEKIIAVMAPEDFTSVGEWYEDFSEVTDHDVRQILAEFDHHKFAQYV